MTDSTCCSTSRNSRFSNVLQVITSSCPCLGSSVSPLQNTCTRLCWQFQSVVFNSTQSTNTTNSLSMVLHHFIPFSIETIDFLQNVGPDRFRPCITCRNISHSSSERRPINSSDLMICTMIKTAVDMWCCSCTFVTVIPSLSR